MGYLKSLGTGIIYIGVFLAILTFLPGLPPDTNFTEFNVVMPKKLSDDIGINERLNNPEILFSGEIRGPEDFASYDNKLYTGIPNEYIVQVTDRKLLPVTKAGKKCDGIWDEAKCGKPLGLRFDNKGNLHFAEAYSGIYKVNIKTGKFEKIIDMDKAIDGIKPLVPNSLDFTSNGEMYWSHSSSHFQLYDGVYSLIADPSGRLMRYNPITKKNDVLIEHLGFANGVKVSEDESFVIVAETSMSRIQKYNIKGPKTGRAEIFAEGLPCLPDNIHSDGQGGFLVTCYTYADEDYPQLFQSTMPHPYIRRMAARFLAILETPLKYLQRVYPNYYAERIIHFVGHFESVKMFTPSIVGVLRLNEKGTVVDAAFGTNGVVEGISSAYVFDNYLWFGSPYAKFIARVPLREALPSLIPKKVEEPSTTVKPQTRPTTTTTTTTTPKPTTTPPPKTTKAPEKSKSEEKKSTKKTAQKVETKPIKENVK